MEWLKRCCAGGLAPAFMSNETLQELLYGKGAHVDPIVCLEDLPAPLAGRKLDGYPHSIWQIVGHMNQWMDYELKRIAEEPQPYPEHAIESWPASHGPANEAAWQEALARFKGLLGKLSQLSESGTDALQRNLAGTHDLSNARSSTVQAILWQLVAHNSYHVGQIALLRRAFGSWPPRRGSDTW
ncbi:conserved hypothetical protein [Candidatus Sulfotelmatobacter sp. SbA7]|nr:conserved hypothetical protein [Candidatus Sulfotelmatobacter sp. SbA7]